MNKAPVTCCPEDSLASVAEKMWKHDCGIVPVVDPDGRVVALVTDRDICMAAWSQGAPLSSIPVRAAMSKQVHAVRSDDLPRVAETMMREKQVRRLPVVEDGGRLIGLLSLNDLARAASAGTDGITTDEVLRTLAAIGERRPPAAAEAEPAAGAGGLRVELRHQLAELEALRDTIRVRLHLAGMEVRDGLADLEPKIDRLEREIAGATEDAGSRIVKSIEQLKRSLRSLREKAGARA
jgi:CBS domain-containing protein